MKNKLTRNNLTEHDGMPSLNKTPKILERLNSKSRNTLISLMVVKDFKVLHGSDDEEVKQKLFCYYHVIEVLAKSPLVLIKYPPVLPVRVRVRNQPRTLEPSKPARVSLRLKRGT